MPKNKSSLSTDQITSSSSSTGGDSEARPGSGFARAGKVVTSNGRAQPYPEKTAERSPTSPRNLRSFFKSSNRQDSRERSVTSGTDLADGSMPAFDANKPSSMSHLYNAGSNNSTPSMGRSAAFDETASMRSAVSGIPESFRSDDEVHRQKTGSHTNIGEHVAQRKGSKGSLPNMLPRSHSRRQIESQDRSHRLRLEQPADAGTANDKDRHHNNLSTAPVGRQDRGFREPMQTQNQPRAHSADRSAVESEDEAALPQQKHSQGTFFTQFRQQGAKAADGIGRAGKGFFGKLKEGRSGSSHEKDSSTSLDHAFDGPFNNLLLPLKEQTRLTRIKKTMEDARDKTEFWMPALPYRCIDYLNHHGIESEGLYRVPGSAAEVKKYQRRFNSPPYYDIDMLHGENEPQDLNVAASLLKAWVRDLPEQLLPKDVQDRIEHEAPNEQSTPQLMRDELSKLPPYNYYLLFAITCHMSLLHAHRETNRMGYGPLRTCWASLDVNAYIFQFLICDWRNCWQGCWTEQEQMLVEQDIIGGTRTASPTPPWRLSRQPFHTQSMPMQDQSAVSAQAAARFANARSPERSDRSLRPDRPERPGRSTPPVAQNTARKPHTSSQPFAQDLGSQQFHQKGPSTPPDAPSHQEIPQMSPLRM